MRLVKLIILSGKHLMLTHVTGHVGVTIGGTVQTLYHLLRHNMGPASSEAISSPQPIIAAPLVDLRPPPLQGCRVGQSRIFLTQQFYLSQ